MESLIVDNLKNISLLFEGSVDRKTFTKIDVIKYACNSKYTDKEGRDEYWVYFEPEKYSVTKEL